MVIMSTITGVLKWDIFIIYIFICVVFCGSCCLVISWLFLCHPSKSENSLNNQAAYKNSASEPLLFKHKTKLQLQRSNSIR